MMVPAVLVRLLLPIALVVSMYLFMRGHNQPGGGFVAGLVMSVAFILQYMVAGTQWVEAQMSLRPLRWMGTGLLFATLTGLGAMAFGYPFLTTHTAHLHLPLLAALAHQSVRAHRPGTLTASPGKPALKGGTA